VSKCHNFPRLSIGGLLPGSSWPFSPPPPLFFNWYAMGMSLTLRAQNRSRLSLTYRIRASILPRRPRENSVATFCIRIPAPIRLRQPYLTPLSRRHDTGISASRPRPRMDSPRQFLHGDQQRSYNQKPINTRSPRRHHGISHLPSPPPAIRAR